MISIKKCNGCLEIKLYKIVQQIQSIIMDFETSEMGINTVNNNWHGNICVVTLIAERSRKSCDIEIKSMNRFGNEW